MFDEPDRGKIHALAPTSRPDKKKVPSNWIRTSDLGIMLQSYLLHSHALLAELPKVTCLHTGTIIHRLVQNAPTYR